MPGTWWAAVAALLVAVAIIVAVVAQHRLRDASATFDTIVSDVQDRGPARPLARRPRGSGAVSGAGSGAGSGGRLGVGSGGRFGAELRPAVGLSEPAPAEFDAADLTTADLIWLCDLLTAHPELAAVAAAVHNGRIDVVADDGPDAVRNWSTALAPICSVVALHKPSPQTGDEDVLKAGRCTVHLRQPELTGRADDEQGTFLLQTLADQRLRRRRPDYQRRGTASS
ncbi:hypothetical protein EV644_112150 [Kribbella orskensis]|uniref:Uncharacterized protein n=1 Tax=Kribbella orskensis TaxID=2512216 RepID=A0ABY2BFF9_9ACTN|nr:MULTISPECIES: hypothetical protein [Kribbella]TCN36977.1 hypothetical protein EV642_113149 [Kribbella sp. VKM Ac-2500]TCO18402.1 hypothetical protein EV644_112150 [Kribbella orskensis]